jgi:2-iminobutanoate/2-iminopropanoate deaminase
MGIVGPPPPVGDIDSLGRRFSAGKVRCRTGRAGQEIAMSPSPTPLFSPARVVPLGGGAKLVFCSGVTARGSTAAGKPVQEQTRECLARLERALAAEGAGTQHILKTTVWLSDMRHYEGFNEVRREVLGALDPLPASTCVGGAQFTSTDVCIEIEAIAVVPGA